MGKRGWGDFADVGISIVFSGLVVFSTQILVSIFDGACGNFGIRCQDMLQFWAGSHSPHRIWLPLNGGFVFFS